MTEYLFYFIKNNFINLKCTPSLPTEINLRSIRDLKIKSEVISLKLKKLRLSLLPVRREL